MSNDFDKLVNDALNQEFSGWDFSYLKGRWREETPSWDYRQLVMSHIKRASSLLDMGTGGGEFLASIPDLPASTCATENYAPNIPIAKARLNPLGIKVFTLESDDDLPFSDNTFDLIINRHESYSAHEVYRVLQLSGRFLTQQVGSEDNIELNQWLQETIETSDDEWSLAGEIRELESVGFEIVAQQEEYPLTEFKDIGAVVYYLKAIPWQIPDFDIDVYRDRLLALHEQIQQTGGFRVRSHRFYLEGIKHEETV